MLYIQEPNLFEESYNWLNFPYLPPPIDLCPETDLEASEEYSRPIDFEELEVDGSASSSTSNTLPDTHSTSVPTTGTPFQNQADSIFHNSMKKHQLEFRQWRDMLHTDSLYTLWWVCQQNSNHIWRESVKSRVHSGKKEYHY